MKKLIHFVTENLRWLVRSSDSIRLSKNAGEESRDQTTLVPCDVHPECIVSLVDEIVRLMKEEKVYKCPDLDLKGLSEKLKTPSYLVTKAINEGLGLNFYELINGYRVEEVKSLLIYHDHKKFTLMSVASNAGFNSKTTFNTVFKKMTGLTPSSYRNQYCLTAQTI